jgi:pimeloyl-ACP methyl ester carboxylesterase
MKDFLVEDISIPIDSDKMQLDGSIFYNSETPIKAPWIIILDGFLAHRGSDFVKSFSEKFVSAGYYVLSYDYRGHGKNVKEFSKFELYKMTPKIFSDIHDVISWVLENKKDILLEEELILFGRSYGGAIILTRGFIDKRVKKIIALCTRYDYLTVQLKIPEDAKKKIAEMISPKIFLKKDPSNNKRILIAHCKDDERIPFVNVLQIKDHLGLSDDNVLIYEKGGHSFQGLHDDIFNCAVEFLKKYKKGNYN